MLVKRLRRWSNNKPTLDQCLRRMCSHLVDSIRTQPKGGNYWLYKWTVTAFWLCRTIKLKGGNCSLYKWAVIAFWLWRSRLDLGVHRIRGDRVDGEIIRGRYGVPAWPAAVGGGGDTVRCEVLLPQGQIQKPLLYVKPHQVLPGDDAGHPVTDVNDYEVPQTQGAK